MIDFIFKRNFIKFRELAFVNNDEIKKGSEDICMLHSDAACNVQNHQYFKNKKIICNNQETLINMLDVNQDDLWHALTSNYRNEIRRSEKENISVSYYNSRNITDKLLYDFDQVYNEMFETKDMNNRLNMKLITSGLKSENFLISVAYTSDKKPVVYHGYLIDDKSAILLYSASGLWVDTDERKLIGWANKRLHWEDFLYLKQKSFTKYEWGGISSSSEPNGIDKFKMGFGGELAMYQNCHVAMTPLGNLFLLALKRKLKRNIINGDTEK